MSDPAQRWFIGIGVSGYRHRHEPLPRAVADVREFGQLLVAGPPTRGRPRSGEPPFTATVHDDPERATVRRLLGDHPGRDVPGPGPDLVVMWSSHAARASDGLLLATTDTGADWADAVPARELLRWVADGPARQTLLVMNTCFAGATLSAVDLVNELLADPATERSPGWLGVLAASGPEESARDGLLGRKLRQLLTTGPRDTAHRLRWSAYRAMVTGQEFAEALIDDWPEPAPGAPSAWFRGSDRRANGPRPYDLFPNPLYQPGAPPVVVEHLLWAAHGTGTDGPRALFTGRTVEVDRVVGWVRDQRPGLRVVTGPAGSGKSAIVGRVVSLADPAERDWLAAHGDIVEHDDPGPYAVHANVHARELTADQVAQALDDQLIGAHLIPAAEDGRLRDAGRLADDLRSRHDQGLLPVVPVIVIDGLDEARLPQRQPNGVLRRAAFEIVERVVLPLARTATVIVATRDLGDDSRSGPGLLARLCGDTPPGLDLGADEFRDSGADAVRRYVQRRLADPDGATPALAPAAVAAALLEGPLAGDTSPFLLARIVTDQLLAEAAPSGGTEQPSAPGAGADDRQRPVSTTLSDALHADLRRVAPGGRAGETDPAAHAELMLTALTWGLGSGFPEREWLAVASALAVRAGLLAEGAAYRATDVDWLLSQAGRYVLQDSARFDGGASTGGAPVYRIAHQSIVDLLRPRFVPNPDQVFDPAAVPVALALLALARQSLDSGESLDDHPYLSRHLWLHVVAAGTDAIEASATLPYPPDDRVLLAIPLQGVGRLLLTHGQPVSAAEMLRRSAALLGRERGFVIRGAYAETLNFLAGAEAELGDLSAARDAAERAVTQARLLHAVDDQDPMVCELLADCLATSANAHAESDPRRALDEADEVARLVVPEDSDARFRALSATVTALTRTGDAPAALRAAEQARRLLETTSAEGPQAALLAMNTSAALAAGGDRRAGEALAADAVRRYRALRAEATGSYQAELVTALLNHAMFTSDHDPATAQAAAAEALDLAGDLHDRLGGFAGLTGAAGATLARALVLTGAPQARRVAVQAADRLRPLAADEPTHQLKLAEALLAAALAVVSQLGALASHGPPDGMGSYADEGLRHATEAMGLVDSLAREHPGRYRAEWLEFFCLYTEVCVALNSPEAASRYSADAQRYARENAAANGHLGLSAGVLLAVSVLRYDALDPDADRSAAAEAIALQEEVITILTPLAAADPASHLVNLCLAERRLAVNLEEHDPYRSSALTDSAVERLKPAYAGRPEAYASQFAEALNHRAVSRAEPVAGIPDWERALEVLLPYAVGNGEATALLYQIAENLADALRSQDRPADAVWAAVEEAVDPLRRLRAELSGLSPSDTPGAVTLLQRELARPGLDSLRRYQLRGVAAQLRGEDPAGWDRCWAEHDPAPLPPWLRLDFELVNQHLHCWFDSESAEDQQSLLRRNPLLLEPRGDAEFEEASAVFENTSLVDVDPLQLRLARGIRALGQQEGVAAANRAEFTRRLAAEYVAAPFERQRELASAWLPLLGEALSGEAFAELAGGPEPESGGPMLRGLGLLVLAEDPDRLDLLPRLPPDLDPESLVALARDATLAGAQAITVQALALLAEANTEATRLDLHTIAAYQAIAAITEGGAADSVEALPAALRTLRSAAGRRRGDAWRTDLAALLPAHPALGALAEAFDVLPAEYA